MFDALEGFSPQISYIGIAGSRKMKKEIRNQEESVPNNSFQDQSNMNLLNANIQISCNKGTTDANNNIYHNLSDQNYFTKEMGNTSYSNSHPNNSYIEPNTGISSSLANPTSYHLNQMFIKQTNGSKSNEQSTWMEPSYARSDYKTENDLCQNSPYTLPFIGDNDNIWHAYPEHNNDNNNNDNNAPGHTEFYNKTFDFRHFKANGYNHVINEEAYPKMASLPEEPSWDEPKQFTPDDKDSQFMDSELDMIEDIIKTEIDALDRSPSENSYKNISASCPEFVPDNNKFRSNLEKISRIHNELYSSCKDRMKKNNHNKVERARRDNINYRIKELASLLPPSILADIKFNKGTILKASVNYIREFQNYEKKIKVLEERQKCLEDMCAQLLEKLQVMESNKNIKHMSDK